jgi:hypothetical protein
MDKLKRVLEIKANSFIERIPERGNKSAFGKQKRLEFFIKNGESFEKEINQSIFEFSKSNNFDEDDLNRSKDIVKEYFRLESSFI